MDGIVVRVGDLFLLVLALTFLGKAPLESNSGSNLPAKQRPKQCPEMITGTAAATLVAS